MWYDLANIEFADMPWLIWGDFNCTLTEEDKRGGSLFKTISSTLALQAFISASSFQELGYMGCPYTWSNNRKREQQNP